MGNINKREKKEEHSDVVKGKHILVVDDIEVNRIILVKILSTLGATCDTAGDGQEAVDAFEKSQPGEYDLILMDVQMPVMNGYAATRAIRASEHPSAKTVPIIAMTANAFVDDVRDAIESGILCSFALFFYPFLLLIRILNTLAENLPDNQFPMMMYAKNDQGDTHIMTLIRSQGSGFFDNDGNFDISSDEGKAALQWIAEGKEKGWFPPSCENLEIVDMTELFTNGQLAITMANNARYDKLDKSFLAFVYMAAIMIWLL